MKPMPEAIQYQTATVEDIEAIRILAERVWHQTYTHMVPQGQIEHMLTQRYARNVLQEQLQRGDLIKLARQGKLLRAFTHATVGDSSECQLDKLYVDTTCQRQGIGEALVLAVKEWAIDRDLQTLVLRVNRNNKQALAAYRKYGFRIVGEDQKPIGCGYVMDDFIMALEIGG